MKQGNKYSTVTVILFFVLLFPYRFLFSEIEVSGYYKSFFTLLVPESIVTNGESTEVPDLGIYSSKLRLKLFLTPFDWLNFRIEYEVTPTLFDQNAFNSIPVFFVINNSKNRIEDLPGFLYPSGTEIKNNFYINQNLDRFFATLSFDFADIYIGRQSISWGSSYVINPTDIISPFNFNEIDKEERYGVDAVRVRIPVGTMDELDIGYVFGEKGGLDYSTFFLRGKFNVINTDLSVILIGFKRNLLLGFDISGSLGGAGVRFEWAYILDKFFDSDYEEALTEDYYRFSLGFDYNFSDKIYSYIEYHYNSPGMENADDYITGLTGNAYGEGSVYLLGKRYISLGIGYKLHPLVPFNGFIMYNLSDNSIIFAPVVEYNVSENIYVSAGAYIGIGKAPVCTENNVVSLRSEFGSYPDMIFTSFRIYF